VNKQSNKPVFTPMIEMGCIESFLCVYKFGKSLQKIQSSVFISIKVRDCVDWSNSAVYGGWASYLPTALDVNNCVNKSTSLITVVLNWKRKHYGPIYCSAI